jgi:XTP/dITP diphosphohydrolase
MELCFATNNKGKLAEIKHLLSDQYTILSLQDIGCNEDLEETQPTIEGNSLQKASYVYEKYKISCFADDTGLEVNALNGAPGVVSARYAGPDCSPEDNMNLLLKNLEGKSDRSASFKTVITLIINGKPYTFTGFVDGIILNEKRGAKGFGYDPIFQPVGFSKTFAEMSMEEKNPISHRGRAVAKLITFLKEQV